MCDMFHMKTNVVLKTTVTISVIKLVEGCGPQTQRLSGGFTIDEFLLSIEDTLIDTLKLKAIKAYASNS